MAKLYGNPIPHPDKPHVVYLLLEKDTGERVEVPVRKAKYESLPAAKKLAYALECAEYHSGDGPGWMARRAARRAQWDADDKAAEEAKWKAEPVGKSEDGTKVKVHVVHGGFAVTVEVPADAADPAQAIKDAWAVAKTEHDAKQAELAAFSI